MTVIAKSPAIASPCIEICSLEAVSGLCTGCGRSIAEITSWIGLSDAERSRIMAELPERIAALRAAYSAEQA